MDFAKKHKLVAMKDAKGRPLYAKESYDLDERLSDREMAMFTKAHTALHTRYHKQALQIIKFIDSVAKHKDKWTDSYGDYVKPKMNPELKLSKPNSVEYQQGRGRGDWSFLIQHGKVRYNNRNMPWKPKSGELPFDKFMKLLDTWKKETLRESVELDEKPFLKKIKMDKFSRSERQRKKKNRKSIRKYNKNILGIESNEKTFNQFREEIANVAGSGQVAGIGSEPPVSKAAQKKKQRGATGDIARRSSVPAPKKGDLMAPALGENVETFAGCRVFEVDDDCYGKAVHGRKKWERWNRKFDMENENNATIRTYANKNPGKAVVIKNSRTGDMAYLINKKY
jgi:hypothetical protein